MKLSIERLQEEKRGLFGGHKGNLFKLKMKLELTPEEREVVERFNYLDGPASLSLGEYIGLNHKGELEEHKAYFSFLVAGYETYPTYHISQLINLEEQVISNLRSLKNSFETLRSFVGGEVIEI